MSDKLMPKASATACCCVVMAVVPNVVDAVDAEAAVLKSAAVNLPPNTLAATTVVSGLAVTVSPAAGGVLNTAVMGKLTEGS